MYLRSIMLAVMTCLVSGSLFAQAAALGTGSANTAQNNSSLSFTVPAGNNRVLIVAVETIGNPSAVSFNGQPLTEIGSVDAGAGVVGELWGIALGSGGSIASTVSASGFNTSNSWNVVAAQAFENIDQATPWAGFVGTSPGASPSSIDITSEAGDIVFDAIVSQGTAPMSASVGAGQTQAFQSTTGNGLGAGSYEAGAATTTMSWTYSGFAFNAHMGINLNGVVAQNTATITVTKTFVDPINNPTVEIGISCSEMGIASPAGSTTIGDGGSVVFNLTGFDGDVAPECTLTETNLASGYVQTNVTGSCDANGTISGIVNAGEYTCDFENTARSAQFTVNKVYSDDNTAAVDVQLLCTSGSISDGGVGSAAPGAPAAFTITAFEADATCAASETVPTGYSLGVSIDPCSADTTLDQDTGGTYDCTLLNEQNAVQVVSAKSYTVAHPTATDPEVELTLFCEQATVSTTNPDDMVETPAGLLGEATKMTSGGIASFWVSNFPSAGANCYVTETVPAGYVQSSTTCGTSFADPGYVVVPGADLAICTIENRPTEAVYTIGKDFSDDNPELMVEVTPLCTDIAPGQVITYDPPTGMAGESTDVAVTVNYFTDGASCTASEVDPVGYTEDTAVGTCDDGAAISDDDGDASCEIFNQQDPVDIVAAKVYSSGDGPAATFEAACTGGTVIVDPTTQAVSGGSTGTFTVSDFPWDGAVCDITEPVPPGGYFVESSDCEGLSIVPSDDDTSCTITNAVTRATFEVTKNFADGNNVDEIEVAIDCNTGLILDQDKDLGDGESVEFVVTSFTEGSLECTITEDGQAGYSGVYENLTITGAPVESDESCFYAAEEIVGNSEHECVITNTPDPVAINIYKDWVFVGQNAPDLDTYIEIGVGCDSEILVDLTECPVLGPASDVSPYESTAGGGFFYYPYTTACLGSTGLNDVGMTVWVVPAFPSTQCTVEEYVADQSIEMDNGCGTFNVSVNNGKDCTITNTVFYEGIPTLSQYGMVLLALLMLGVGFVSFRRFA